MRLGILSAVSLAGCLGASLVFADDNGWRPIIAQSGSSRVLSSAGKDPVVQLGKPIPVSLDKPRPWTNSSTTPGDPIIQLSAREYFLESGDVVRAQSPEPPPGSPAGPPPASTPGAADPLTGPDPYAPPPIGVGGEPPPEGPGFWSKAKDWMFGSGPVAGCGGRGKFQSDHAFDGFISPVTNPFFFEDPRALTEIRPIFTIQSIPSKNWALQGGNAEFFGLQGRLAITDKWSVVLNKLGFVSLNPKDETLFASGTGFAEIDIGPKYTFFRGERSGTLAAAGLTFQLPAGNSRAVQNTGNLSLVPYISFGQNFWRTQYGSVNFLTTGAYSFATDNKRSEDLIFSFHLDYDVANWHRFYPLIEMNWFHYTRSGSARDLQFEGEDLINFGSMGVAGSNYLDLAFGARYKFTEQIQLGTAFEFPITGRKDINDFRWTLDLIFRY